MCFARNYVNAYELDRTREGKCVHYSARVCVCVCLTDCPAAIYREAALRCCVVVSVVPKVRHWRLRTATHLPQICSACGFACCGATRCAYYYIYLYIFWCLHFTRMYTDIYGQLIGCGANIRERRLVCKQQSLFLGSNWANKCERPARGRTDSAYRSGLHAK